MIIFKNRGSYVLVTLSILFAFGAAIRFVPSNAAVADTTFPDELPLADVSGADAPKDAGISKTALVAVEQVCFTNQTASDLAADMAYIDEQIGALNERELSIKSREAQLEARSIELGTIQSTLDDRWDAMQSASVEDIQHLARMYSSMKPDNAAAIFNQMVPEFAGGFLRSMRSEQAGLIMANMDPRKAYAVSMHLASVNEDIRQSSMRE